MVTAKQISELRAKRNTKSNNSTNGQSRTVSGTDIAALRKRKEEKKVKSEATGRALQEFIRPSDMNFAEQNLHRNVKSKQMENYNNSPNRYNDIAKRDKDYTNYVKKGTSVENPSLPGNLDFRYSSIFNSQPFAPKIANKATYAKGIKSQYKDMTNFGGSTGVNQIKPQWLELADDEVNTYNYYLGKFGEEKADEYLKALDDILKDRVAKGISNDMSDDPIQSTINATNAGFLNSITGLKQVGSRITGNTNPIDRTSIEESYDYMRPNLKGGQKIAADIGYSAGNMAPSIAVGAATGVGGLGAVTMGVGTAGSTYNEARREGKSDSEALTYSALVGASEGGLQYALGGIGTLGKGGLSKLISKTPIAKTVIGKIDDVLKAVGSNPSVVNAFKGVGKFALSMNDEGFEEYLQEILTPIYRNIVFDENNEFKVFSEDALYSYMVGAITGGMFNSVGAVTDTINTSRAGKQVNASGNIEDYMSAGKNMGENTDLYKAALEMETAKLNNKKPSNYQVGNLARSIDGATNQNISRQINQVQSVPMERQENIPVEREVVNTAERTNEETFSDTPMTSQLKQAPSEMVQAKDNVPNTSNALKSQNTTSVEKAIDVVAKWGEIEGATVKGISKVENGKVMVTVESGGKTLTDSVENVTFENPAVQEVYNASSEYQTNGAKAFVSNYKGTTDLPVYQKAFNAYYDAGVVNIPINKIQSAYGAFIPQSVRLNAYGAGVNDAKLKIQTSNVGTEKAKPTQKKITEMIPTEAGKKIDESVRDGLNALAKATGLKIRVEETLAGGKANGLYKDGTLFIARDSDNPYMVVAKHELTHAIQQYSPEAYKTYKDFVIKEINKSNPKAYNEMVDSLMMRYSNIGQNITRSEVMDEIVADASEMFLTDPEVIQRLAEQDKNLAQKIIDFLRDLIEKIQTAMSGYDAKSSAAIALNENLEVAKEAEDLWVKALASIKKDIKIDTKTKDTDVQLSLKEFADEDDFIKYNKTGEINDNVYENNDFDIFKVGNYPNVIRTYNTKKGDIEFRQSGEVLRYVKTNTDGNIVYDENGMAAYLSKEDMLKNGLLLHDASVMAFTEDGVNIGFSSNEFGADGVFVKSEYQKLGIGTELLHELRKQFNNPNRKIGQMTSYGEKMARSYYNKYVNHAPDSDVRFQLKDVDAVEYNRVLSENRKLKEINSLLNEQFALTQELKPNRKQLERASKEILKKVSSSYDSKNLTDNLENIWKFIHDYPDSMYTDEVVEATTGMAVMILKKSQTADTSLLENSREMLDDIKKTPLILSQKDRSDLASEGGINNFRKKYIGRIKIVTENGIKVDEYFHDLSQRYPEYFNEDEISHPADQLIKIADTIDFIKPIYHNPYGMNIDEAARDLAYDIISTAYFDVKQAPSTFADKKKIELEKLKMKYNKKVREIHDEYRTKYSERLANIKVENDKKISALMEKSKTANAEEKETYKQQIGKLRDQNIQKLKAQQERFAECRYG